MAFGLRPVARMGGSYMTGSEERYPIASVTYNVFSGDFIEINSGYAVRQNGTAGETPTTTNATSGVAVGFEYTNSEGQTMWNNYLPLNTAGYCYVVTDPMVVYEVQSSAAIVTADIGRNAAVSGFASTSGSTDTGNSGIQLDHTTMGTAATLALRVISLPDMPGGTGGLSSNTDIVRVAINPTVHRFFTGKGL